MPIGLKIGEWVQGFPTEAGAYLFYGGPADKEGVVSKPTFFLGKAAVSGNGVLMFIGDGRFLYPSEVSITHATFACDPPRTT